MLGSSVDMPSIFIDVTDVHVAQYRHVAEQSRALFMICTLYAFLDEHGHLGSLTRDVEGYEAAN
jgi:hypothetical protein